MARAPQLKLFKLEHQHGSCDVMCKRSIILLIENVYLMDIYVTCVKKFIIGEAG
jgi:hypothetical protein